MNSTSALPREVALVRAQRTPERLEGDATHTALAQAETDVVQARESRRDVPARPAPEDLRRGRCARPDDRVEVLRARLLGPQVVLPAEDQVVLVGRQVREWVERVGVLPRLEGVAPGVTIGESACEPVLLEGSVSYSPAWVVTDPASTSTVL